MSTQEPTGGRQGTENRLGVRKIVRREDSGQPQGTCNSGQLLSCGNMGWVLPELSLFKRSQKSSFLCEMSWILKVGPTLFRPNKECLWDPTLWKLHFSDDPHEFVHKPVVWTFELHFSRETILWMALAGGFFITSATSEARLSTVHIHQFSKYKQGPSCAPQHPPHMVGDKRSIYICWRNVWLKQSIQRTFTEHLLCTQKSAGL